MLLDLVREESEYTGGWNTHNIIAYYELWPMNITRIFGLTWSVTHPTGGVIFSTGEEKTEINVTLLQLTDSCSYLALPAPCPEARGRPTASGGPRP